MLSRNKRCVTIDLKDSHGRTLLLRLLETADVLIENFRTGTLEKWELGPDRLRELNPGLILVRTTGFGQTGPLRNRPGFGTIAEAMSGFAHVNGTPEGPPLLPPYALGDRIAGLYGAFATMVALHERNRSGLGQIIDLSIYEPLFAILGPQVTVVDQLGVIPERNGNKAPFPTLRDVFRSRDGVWLAVSAATPSVVARIAAMVGFRRGDEGSISSGTRPHEDIAALTDALTQWIAARDSQEVIGAFEQAEAAISPVYSAADALEDPQFLARESVATVADPRFGPVRLPNVVPRLSRTPGSIRWLGPPIGAHNHEVIAQGLDWPAAEQGEGTQRPS
jgi:formyl-CoA transferase